ncbi:MAG: hypothetical protein JO148_15840, partial [Acidimicrobiia bacterium]|nr:hypothetical protein [Acidimicrobiia bacterium]
IVSVIETAIDAHDEAEKAIVDAPIMEPVNVEPVVAEPAGPATINLTTENS